MIISYWISSLNLHKIKLVHFLPFCRFFPHQFVSLIVSDFFDSPLFFGLFSFFFGLCPAHVDPRCISPANIESSIFQNPTQGWIMVFFMDADNYDRAVQYPITIPDEQYYDHPAHPLFYRQRRLVLLKYILVTI